MRLVVAVTLLLALPVGGCGWRPVYENPPLQGKIERLWKERDDCLLANAPQFDDRSSDIRRVARHVAAACATQTTRLMEMTIPEPDQKARDAFQEEAARRALHDLEAHAEHMHYPPDAADAPAAPAAH